MFDVRFSSSVKRDPDCRLDAESEKNKVNQLLLYAIKSCVSCFVIEPGLPSPTGLRSISVMGTTSAAVPVAKHSSAT